jgi:hypothetical protein
MVSGLLPARFTGWALLLPVRQPSSPHKFSISRKLGHRDFVVGDCCCPRNRYPTRRGPDCVSSDTRARLVRRPMDSFGGVPLRKPRSRPLYRRTEKSFLHLQSPWHKKKIGRFEGVSDSAHNTPLANCGSMDNPQKAQEWRDKTRV